MFAAEFSNKGQIPGLKTGLVGSKSIIEFLLQMYIYIDYIMIYQLEGRYPENEIDSPTQEISEDYFHQTKEFMEWLIKKL